MDQYIFNLLNIQILGRVHHYHHRAKIYNLCCNVAKCWHVLNI